MQPDWSLEIEKRLAALELHHAVNAVHRDHVGERLTAIEDTLRWLMRLVVGGLLMGILGYVLKGGLLLNALS